MNSAPVNLVRFTTQQGEDSSNSPISMLSSACSAQKYCRQAHFGTHPPHAGAPGSPHSKQKKPLIPQFQCSHPPALPKSTTAGNPIWQPTAPHDGAPGSPHSKQKTPLIPRFQCSRPPALPKGTVANPILEPTPPNPGAPGLPQSAQQIPPCPPDRPSVWSYCPQNIVFASTHGFSRAVQDP